MVIVLQLIISYIDMEAELQSPPTACWSSHDA